jgi:hypothetical protein
MLDTDLIVWAEQEHKERIDDISAVKNGSMTLIQAQKSAERRRKAVGLGRSAAARAVHGAAVKRRSEQC